MRELTQEKPEQQLLFEKIDRGRSSSLMKAMDAVNANMGRHTVSYASSGLTTDFSAPKAWRTQFNHKSPAYTTRWDQLLGVTWTLPNNSACLNEKLPSLPHGPLQLWILKSRISKIDDKWLNCHWRSNHQGLPFFELWILEWNIVLKSRKKHGKVFYKPWIIWNIRRFLSNIPWIKSDIWQFFFVFIRERVLWDKIVG